MHFFALRPKNLCQNDTMAVIFQLFGTCFADGSVTKYALTIKKYKNYGKDYWN